MNSDDALGHMIEFIGRVETCYALLGLHPVGRRVGRALYADDGPRTRNALSRELRVPRSTIREIVRELESVGAVEVQNGHLNLTEQSRARLERISAETLRISFGLQRGYSSVLRGMMQEAGASSLRRPHPDAWGIEFPPDLPLPEPSSWIMAVLLKI